MSDDKGTDFCEGMHRAANIAEELLAIAKKCRSRPCCLSAIEALRIAILSEANKETTQPLPLRPPRFT